MPSKRLRRDIRGPGAAESPKLTASEYYVARVEGLKTQLRVWQPTSDCKNRTYQARLSKLKTGTQKVDSLQEQDTIVPNQGK